MLRCTLSKNDYDNNVKVKLPSIFNLNINAQDGEIVKTMDFKGETRYVLEFKNISVPQNIKSGLYKE